MSLKLICEVNEDINYITEDKDDSGKKSYFIEGVFMQGDIKNRNGTFLDDTMGSNFPNFD